MNFNQVTWNWIVVAIIVAIVIVTEVMHALTSTKKNFINQLREAALMLFIEAQKSGMVGPDKMQWAVAQLFLQFPNISKVLQKQTVEQWAQALYDQFKCWISSQIPADDKVVKAAERK